jgi:Flp pilus assembly pilin Flp
MAERAGLGLLRDRRGASALEYALVAPLLFAVVFVAIEVTVILFADAVLEGTANRVTRIGRLGVPEGSTCEGAVRRTLEDNLDGWVVDSTDLRLDVRVYTPGQGIRFDDVDDEDYTPICDAGERGDIVMYRLGLDRPGLTGMLSWLGIDIVRLERTVVIQNEP